MSGILNEAFTPCPSRSRSSGFSEHSGSDTFDSLLDGESVFEPTGQIEYTTEVRAPILTGVRPRRANRAGNTFHVHEDIAEKPAGPAEKRRRPNAVPRGPSDRKSSLLAQPAQRFRPKVNFAPSPPSRHLKLESETLQIPQTLQLKTSDGSLSVARPALKGLNWEDQGNGLKKNVRRNTVYIPPDDTTVASVFMGLFSPLKNPCGNAVPPVAEDTQVNTLEAQIAKRQARKSLAVSARRAPLQPSTKIAQEATFRVDVAGKNGGKENVPPGAVVKIEKKSTTEASVPSKPKRISTAPVSKPARRTTTTHQLRKSESTSSVAGAKKQSAKRGVLGEKQNSVQLLPPSLHLGKGLRTESKDRLKNASASLNARASALSERRDHPQTGRASKVGNVLRLKELNHQYPMLTENISEPSLYEDNWLSHQETVITQLVNALFECTNGDPTAIDPHALRLEFLELYHTEYFTQLYQRLQASLSCGILSIPKDVLARDSRLKQDVGLRRKYLDIWIQSYDLRALVPALETVVGRKVSSDSNLFDHASEPFGNELKARNAISRKIERFLDAFLLHNDDIDHVIDAHAETHAKSYRRTVLRSIVLVILLDQARQNLGTGLPRRLFVSSSPYKSSVEVLHALSRLLLPSAGDITKALGHLGCYVSYKQHQLQEYDYLMDNIAVDLRDGVRLTRIVEVLFYTSEHLQTELEDLTEVTLSSGEALSLLGDERDLPLSKHLKYPCVSRATKIHNVQIALSALNPIKGSGAILRDVRAEDIVDGYREKTIALLWALVSKWGLSGLVDWEDLSKDIARLQRKACSQLGYDWVKDEQWFTRKPSSNNDEHAASLQQWAAILAALNGLTISNMTTSFADGKIYGSIIDEYEPYITGSAHQDTELMNRHSVLMSLEPRLRLLGCSSQFACLVSPGKASSHLLDGDFTLAALAFLCSRLLSASKRARAATVLQRAWRAHISKRDEFRRMIARNLAAHCAAVVQTRNEIIWAKEVITRYWRKHQAWKGKASNTRYRTLQKAQRQQRKTAGRPL
ncbi:uncharacterized protein N7482_008155 [Penicillium canariense]|uniref:Calponin-homology (CH) domain-containing protein n=1 Tax=Penicillium canariense TaxID=189055 RepID=A0A9W9HVG1_9EURO|nr:uncharacterized protein N7482_008155 [Penicillium canariense]KAJ5157055.1 hypothetical protein N7482_008155 [Penicillium canariense]